jgi:DnaJ-class molecular chaperone
MDHYSTLGVDRNASPEDIKRAYRKLASQHHPDKGGDKTRFQDIQVAYDTLSNPDKRSQYDNPMPQGFHQHGGMPPGFDLPPEQAQIPLIVKSSIPISIKKFEEYTQQQVFDTILDLFNIETQVADKEKSFIKKINNSHEKTQKKQ